MHLVLRSTAKWTLAEHQRVQAALAAAQAEATELRSGAEARAAALQAQLDKVSITAWACSTERCSCLTAGHPPHW